MVKVTTSTSGLSPATAVGSPRARIDSADSATMAAMDATADKAHSIQFDDEAIRSHGSDEDDEREDEEEKAEFGDVKTTAELLGEVEELSLRVSQRERPLPVERNLAAELKDDADDDDDDAQGVAQGDRPPLIPRATRNADMPSANRVLARLSEEMRPESEWMMMFAPVAMTQAKWSVLGAELTQPVNSTDINQLVEDTVLLLKAMGFRCNIRPNSLIQGDWSLSRARAELRKWKRRLRLAFGLERYVGSRQMIARRTAEFPGPQSDPSRVPLQKTPETKKGKKEVFRATKGTPYYEDSHIQTPKTLKGRSARYAKFYDAADEAELGGGDSDDDRDYRDSAEDSAKDVIRRLSLDYAERDRGHYLEVRSHASLDKIAEFEGKRYRSDYSLQLAVWWGGIGNFAFDLDPSAWDEKLVFAFTLPGSGYTLARPTLHQDIEYPKIEVNPDAKIAGPGVCQLSFQPTARGSGKQGKEYIPPKATPGQDRHRPTSPDQSNPRSSTQAYIGAASRNIPAAA
ncbi:unnamed protein product [Phytophthora fragariaefolia]|uniref:Unnamed protein product n=1 Tax=Phytophthora fragariaefolia TaxID=1490495 RepID=A0A9W7D5D7_9STRA|nr:unnamed protein product [Phytophthora fragariaefolia]